MIKEFDYRKYLVHDLPITQAQYHRNVSDFFGKSIGDFANYEAKILNGRDIAIYVNEKVKEYRLHNPVWTIKDLISLYNDDVYLARNICHEFLLQLPPTDQLFNHYEFFVPACLLKDRYPDEQLYALDHGSAMGWQGMLMWCFGYHVTFCDLPTKYFEFLKFQCAKANMNNVDFIEVDTDVLNLDDKKFDLANSFFVFEHILYPEKDLKEISDHLNEGGYFNLRYDFSHGGLTIPTSAIFGGKPELWKELIRNYGLRETDFFEDHIYKKVTI